MTRDRALGLRLACSLLVLAVSIAACSNSSPGAAAETDLASTSRSTGSVAPTELTVFGAASLKEALGSIQPAYQAAVPDTTLIVATDSSATLRTQIEQGAPADLFLSADQKNPQTLVDAGLTDGPAVAFARNTLTVIVPADNPAGIETPADLARPGVKVAAAGDDVPITAYAERAVGRLATLPGYPKDFSQAYAANIVSREQNVKAVVAKIELGEGDAAIVYITDARASTAVAALAIPNAANVPATDAGVVVAASTRHQAAHAFLDWLVGPVGSAILARFGFQPPP